MHPSDRPYVLNRLSVIRNDERGPRLRTMIDPSGAGAIGARPGTVIIGGGGAGVALTESVAAPLW